MGLLVGFHLDDSRRFKSGALGGHMLWVTWSWKFYQPFLSHVERNSLTGTLSSMSYSLNLWLYSIFKHFDVGTGIDPGWESSSTWTSLLTTLMKLVGITVGLMQFLLFTWLLSISWSFELLGLAAGAIRLFQFMITKDMFLNTWCILIRFFSIL